MKKLLISLTIWSSMIFGCTSEHSKTWFVYYPATKTHWFIENDSFSSWHYEANFYDTWNNKILLGQRFVAIEMNENYTDFIKHYGSQFNL